MTNSFPTRRSSDLLHTRGAYQNLTTGERANGVDTQAMRGSLRFTPDDVWEVNLTADYSELRQDGVLKSILVDEPGLVFRVNDLVTDPLPGPEENIRSGRSRSEEHTSELQSLMRTAYTASCLKKKTQTS